uniref:cation transporter n=1 Tax=Candidatus Cryptobacteroides bacterium TaxID=3085639 RepID=UPI004029A9BC
MDRTAKVTLVTLIGSVVNIILTVFKILAGILGRSTAMIADGIHSLSDLLSDIVVIVFVKISAKG